MVLSAGADLAEVAAMGDAADEAQTGGTRGRSLFAGFRSPKILIGFALLLLFVLVGIFGPLIDTTDPSASTIAILQPPSSAHWLGTTQTGQDVLAQLIDGTRTSLVVGFAAAALATALSLIVGLSAGYLGGAGDEMLSALANIFLVLPALPLVIVLAGYLPSKGSLAIAVVISITGWAWGARVLRAQTLSFRRRDFVEAARVAGERPLRIIFAEILPNEGAIVASIFLGTVIFAVLTQAGLAFLGLSNVSVWSWGTMLYWAQNDQALQAGAWWWFVPPGLCLALLGTSLALINFGIDEFVNPRLRAAGAGAKKAAKAVRRQVAVNAQHVSPRPAAAGSSVEGFTSVRRSQAAPPEVAQSQVGPDQ
jgi:peptide/nickel transport system permease protein